MPTSPHNDETNATELERLLWERIDGTIEAAGLGRLRELLASEPGAERLQAEIAQLASELDAAAEAPMPAGLGEGIRDALRAATGSAEAPSGGISRGKLHRFVATQPVRRLAYLAAGLVIAMVAYQLVTNDPRSAGSKTGPFVGTAGLTEPEPAIATVRLELPDSRGLLTISRGDGALGLELETSPSFGRASLVMMPGVGLTIESAEQRGEATFEVLSSDRALEVEIAGAGVVELVVAAPGGGRAITVALVDGDQTLLFHDLVLEQKEDSTNK